MARYKKEGGGEYVKWVQYTLVHTQVNIDIPSDDRMNIETFSGRGSNPIEWESLF